MSEANRTEVIIIGSGFSGLCLGHHLKRDGKSDFVILEKDARLGGTWRDNSYPGAACDVPSFAYCFSFAQKTDWSRKWSPQSEILAYTEEVADRFDLRRHVRFNQEVTRASWDERTAEWTVETRSGETWVARHLVSGVGQLNMPAWPDIPGRDTFKGTAFHSARWDHDANLAGKRVAVIGNAASAIQFIPEIAAEVGSLLIFQRSANWMMPRMDREYTEAEHRRFARWPWLAKLYRWSIWARFDLRFPVFAGNRWLGALVRKAAEKHLEEAVPDPVLRKALTPDYPVGAKRLLISDNYYRTLGRDNVRLLTERIERITETGVVTADGTEHQADVLIFATGFRSTEFLVPMEIRGRDGRLLSEEWKEGAEAYLGITVPSFPNFFMMYGPNTNLGHNSIIFMIECQAGYIMSCLGGLERAGATAFDLRPEVSRAFNDRLQERLRDTVWARVSASWYKNKAGRITNNWSGTTTAYWWATRRADLSDYRLSSSAADGNASEPAGTTGRTAA